MALLDDDWPVLTLSVSRTVVPESAGNDAVLATLQRDPVSSEALTVWLTNTDATAVSVPDKVTIPANQAILEFPLGAVDDDLADGSQTSEIRAEIRLGSIGTVVESNLVSIESNNSDISDQPIDVFAAYEAIVQTDVDLVPANTPVAFAGSAARSGGAPRGQDV